MKNIAGKESALANKLEEILSSYNADEENLNQTQLHSEPNCGCEELGSECPACEVEE